MSRGSGHLGLSEEKMEFDEQIVTSAKDMLDQSGNPPTQIGYVIGTSPVTPDKGENPLSPGSSFTLLWEHFSLLLGKNSIGVLLKS